MIEPVEAAVRWLEFVNKSKLILPDESTITSLAGDLGNMTLRGDDAESLSTYFTEIDAGEILHPQD